MSARLPACAGLCRQGRDVCTCNGGPRMPAEACTELGADAVKPIGYPPVAFLFGPFIDRWPRFAGLAALLALVLLLGFSGEPPELLEPLASPYLPGDGFPAELLAVDQAASGVQP